MKEVGERERERKCERERGGGKMEVKGEEAELRGSELRREESDCARTNGML